MNQSLESTEDQGRSALRYTTVQDLLASVECNTRIAILAGLDGSQDEVSRVAMRLRLPVSLLSNHLRVLRNAGLVEFHGHGQRRIYQLTARAQATWSEERLTIMLVAGDGSNLLVAFPRASHMGKSIEGMAGWGTERVSHPV